MLPPPLGERVQTEQFWTEFLFVDENDSTPWHAWRVVFPTGGSSWSLELSADATGYVSLSLVGGGRSVELAWDDLAHWHPHLLRWTELDAVCRAVERVDPALAHPGFPLLLLARFAPVLTDADAAEAFPLIEAAWQRVPLASRAVRRRLLEIVDLRSSGAGWQRVPQLGWCLRHEGEVDGPPVYSLRVEGNREFPWQAWQEFTRALGVANVEEPGGGRTRG